MTINTKIVKKSWYVFKGKHHLGPFFAKDIMKEKKSGKLEGALFWKEGLKAPLDNSQNLDSGEEVINHWLSFEEVERSLLEEIHINDPSNIENYQTKIPAIPGVDTPPSLEANIPSENLLKRVQTSYESSLAHNIDMDKVKQDAKNEVFTPPKLPPETIQKPSYVLEEEAYSLDDQTREITPPDFNEDLSEAQPEQMQFREPIDDQDEGRIIDQEREEIKKDLHRTLIEIKDSPIMISEAPEDSGNKVKSLFIAGSLVVFLTISLMLYFINQESSGDRVELLGLSLTQQKEVIQFLAKYKNKDNSRDPKYLLKPTISQDSMWLVVPRSKSAFVKIKMKSINGKILGLKNIEAISEAVIENNLGRFTNFNLVEGNFLKEGYYSYEISLRKTDFRSKIYDFLAGVSLFKSFSFIRNHKNHFSHKGKLLYSNSSSKEFSKKLNKYKKKNLTNLISPLSYQLEKYKTYLTLLDKIDQQFFQILGKIRRGRNIQIFTKYYQKKVGPILQELILDNNKSYINKSNTEYAGDYADLIGYGKDIGALVTDLIDAVKTERIVNSRLRREVHNNFDKRINTLRKRSTRKILSLEKKIKTLSN